MIVCVVYKGKKKPDSYLYVDKREGLARVPEALLAQFGALEEALSFKLTEDRVLARAVAADVMLQIEREGYYLQLPPRETDEKSQ